MRSLKQTQAATNRLWQRYLELQEDYKVLNEDRKRHGLIPCSTDRERIRNLEEARASEQARWYGQDVLTEAFFLANPDLIKGIAHALYKGCEETHTPQIETLKRLRHITKCSLHIVMAAYHDARNARKGILQETKVGS